MIFLIALGAVVLVAISVLPLYLLRRDGPLDRGRPVREVPLVPGDTFDIELPALDSREYQLGLRLAYSYPRSQSNVVPPARVDVSVTSVGKQILEGTFKRSGVEFDRSTRPIGTREAWQRSTQRLVRLPPAASAGCTVSGRLAPEGLDRVEETVLVVSTHRP